MFEARHTMDAPTTTSADNGTSGGGSGGWFTPRTQPASTPDSEREAAEGSRLAACLLGVSFGALALALLVSVLATLYPASRAARVDPVTALRHD
jgi:hypothetical protein